MAWKNLKFKVTGVDLLLMHNGQLANPLNKIARAMKEVSSKRKKKDADFEELARLEFAGGLYMGKDGPELPGDLIEATIVNGAKKFKDGPAAKAGLIVTKAAKLEYDGPRDIDGLWKDGRFVHVSGVRVNSSRVMRTRPQFEGWSCEVVVQYDDSLCNPEQVSQWFQKAGAEVGFGDWRPRYGKFTVKAI